MSQSGGDGSDHSSGRSGVASGRFGGYAVLRIFSSVFALWVIVTNCFLMVEFLPGSPFRDETELNPQIRERLEEIHGTNDGVLSRYVGFVSSTFTGNVGPSLLREAAAPDFLAARARNSMGFGAAAFVLAVSFSLIVGFVVSGSERAGLIYWRISQFLISIPTLILVPLLIFLFSLTWPIFPAARLDAPGAWVLPLVALALRPCLTFSRVFVIQIRQVEAFDFVRVHRAMGFSAIQTFLGAVMKNALIPMLAVMPSVLSSLLSGSIIVETMFAIPGLGSTYVDALLNRDLYLITGLTAFYAFLLIIAQLLVDLAIVRVDRRVTLS